MTKLKWIVVGIGILALLTYGFLGAPRQVHLASIVLRDGPQATSRIAEKVADHQQKTNKNPLQDEESISISVHDAYVASRYPEYLEKAIKLNNGDARHRIMEGIFAAAIALMILLCIVGWPRKKESSSGTPPGCA